MIRLILLTRNSGREVFDHSVCCEKLAWNAELTGTLKFKWQRWEQGLPKQIAVTRPLW